MAAWLLLPIPLELDPAVRAGESVWMSFSSSAVRLYEPDATVVAEPA